MVDQLRESDYEKILEFLKNKAEATDFDDIFWLRLPEEIYSDIQRQHAKCHPYFIAVNITMNKVEFEFLIRSRQILRCACIGYADRKQRDYIMDYADEMLSELEIKI